MNLKKNFGTMGIVIGTVVLTGVLVTAGFLLNGLESKQNYEKNSDTQSKIIGTGTIRYLDFEGGFFGIVSDDGEQYLPYELPQEYQLDDLRITFTVKPLEDQMSIYMWGILVEILENGILE